MRLLFLPRRQHVSSPPRECLKMAVCLRLLELPEPARGGDHSSALRVLSLASLDRKQLLTRPFPDYRTPHCAANPPPRV